MLLKYKVNIGINFFCKMCDRTVTWLQNLLAVLWLLRLHQDKFADFRNFLYSWLSLFRHTVSWLLWLNQSSNGYYDEDLMSRVYGTLSCTVNIAILQLASDRFLNQKYNCKSVAVTCSPCYKLNFTGKIQKKKQFHQPFLFTKFQ